MGDELEKPPRTNSGAIDIQADGSAHGGNLYRPTSVSAAPQETAKPHRAAAEHAADHNLGLSHKRSLQEADKKSSDGSSYYGQAYDEVRVAYAKLSCTCRLHKGALNYTHTQQPEGPW